MLAKSDLLPRQIQSERNQAVLYSLTKTPFNTLK